MIRKIIIAVALFAGLHIGFACAQVVMVLRAPQTLDATISQELVAQGATAFPGVYHLWNLGDPGPAIPDAVWADAFAAVAAGDDVWLDIEPNHSANPAWVMPVDPGLASEVEVQETHRLIAEQLEPLCEAAVISGSKVYIYGLYPMVYTRVLEVIADDPDWKADVTTAVQIEYESGKTIASLLDSTGGGVLYECYIPDSWNGTFEWQRTNNELMINNQKAILDELGVKGFPLLNPKTIEGNSVIELVMTAQIAAARETGPIAVWHNYHPDNVGTVPMTSEQKGYFVE